MLPSEYTSCASKSKYTPCTASVNLDSLTTQIYFITTLRSHLTCSTHAFYPTISPPDLYLVINLHLHIYFRNDTLCIVFKTGQPILWKPTVQSNNITTPSSIALLCHAMLCNAALDRAYFCKVEKPTLQMHHNRASQAADPMRRHGGAIQQCRFQNRTVH